jgi:hypothetical protein
VRKKGEWERLIREVDAAVVVGADFSPQVVLCRFLTDEMRLKFFGFCN